MLVTQLSLVFLAGVFAEDTPAVDSLNVPDFDDDFSDDKFDESAPEDGEFGAEDDGASLDSLLENLKGPNGENAENIEKLKQLLASGDDSEDSMAQLQALFDQILGGSLGNDSPSLDDDDADL